MTEPTVAKADFPVKACLLLPTYNNEGTLEGVLAGALGTGLPVVVVNDGSTDGTAAKLAARKGGSPEMVVLEHAENRGKGAALMTGLKYAAEAGFTHAITMDTDGQHDPKEAAAMLAAAAADRGAMIIGVRRLEGGRRATKSRWLRRHSNFWVWAETGTWVEDTQSGFRVYPLAAVLGLHLDCRRYDFEIEALVKALWAGVPVRSVAVSAAYPAGSRSHFRPLVDFVRVSGLNARLMMLRVLLPGPVLGAYVRRDGTKHSMRRRLGMVVRAAAAEGGQTPGRIGASVGLGVACGILPIWGFQMLAALVVAHVLRLNRPLMLIASNISFPAAIPLILLASLAIGQLLLIGTIQLGGARADPEAAIRNYLGAYLVGSVILAAGAAVATGGLAYWAARAMAHLRRKDRV